MAPIYFARESDSVNSAPILVCCAADFYEIRYFTEVDFGGSSVATHQADAMPPNDKNAFYAKQQAERDRANADRDKQAKAKQEIMQAFKVFDLNHDGVVSHDELVRILMRPTGSDAMTKEAAKAFINKSIGRHAFPSCDVNSLTIKGCASLTFAECFPQKDLVHGPLRLLATANERQDIGSKHHFDNSDSSGHTC